MTLGRRKRVAKPPEARRADILRAGKLVFSTTGFAEAKIADIAEAASIGKGTFYLHFRTKDHVLGALWQEYIDAFHRKAEAILARNGAWWPTADELLTTLIKHVLAHAELRRLVNGSTSTTVAEVCRPSSERLMATLSDFARRGAAEGAIEALHPEWAFAMVCYAADGLLDTLISTGTPVESAALNRSVLELAHRTLCGPGLPAAVD